MENPTEKTKRKWYKIWWVWVIIVLVLYAIGSSNKPKVEVNNDQQGQETQKTAEVKKVEEKEAAIKITARELFAQYGANEIKADDQYKNKLLEVSGVVESIGKDIVGTPYVALQSNDMIGTVQCMLASSEKSKASELNKGQSITMIGRNTGKLMNIILNDCVIK